MFSCSSEAPPTPVHYTLPSSRAMGLQTPNLPKEDHNMMLSTCTSRYEKQMQRPSQLLVTYYIGEKWKGCNSSVLLEIFIHPNTKDSFFPPCTEAAHWIHLLEQQCQKPVLMCCKTRKCTLQQHYKVTFKFFLFIFNNIQQFESVHLKKLLQIAQWMVNTKIIY